jgi:hypothetical protein
METASILSISMGLLVEMGDQRLYRELWKVFGRMDREYRNGTLEAEQVMALKLLARQIVSQHDLSSISQTNVYPQHDSFHQSFIIHFHSINLPRYCKST